MIELPPILHLPPVNKEQMEPYPLMRYLNLLKNIYDEVSLDELCEDDLVEEEKAKRKENTDRIVDWVQKCSKDSGQATLVVYPYSMVIFYCMSDLKALLQTALERKLEKVRQEVEKKERQARQEAEQQRRLAVLKEIDPPLSDAKKYLTPKEYEKFLSSLPGAIDAYLSRDEKVESYSPGIWLLNSKAFDYSYWTLIIKERKEEERRQKQAQIKHDQYIDRLSAAVEKFRAELGKSKKPKFVHPPELVKYEPENWCELELPTNQRIQKWAERNIFKILPEILTDLIRWELTKEVQVVPSAVYEVESGIPCLTWYFYTHLLVTASLELKKCAIRERYSVGYMDVETEGEKLGVLYLEHPEWLTPGIFTTPIALLSLLAKGDLEAPGITVIEHDYLSTTFVIQGFEEEVEIYDDFRKYIGDIAKDKPLAEILLAKGLIDKDTAKLVEEKVKLPLPQVLGAGHTFSDDSDVKTALEGMGYKNGDIEVAMEDAPLSPEMSLEEKVEAVLKFLDSNSL